MMGCMAVIIMKTAKRRHNEDRICGWDYQSDPHKQTHALTPSRKRQTVLPQLSLRRHLPAAGPSNLNEQHSKHKVKHHQKRKKSSKRLKSQSFDEARNHLSAIGQESTPIRMFPSLPMLFSAELNIINSNESSEIEGKALQLFNKKFITYRQLQESFPHKLLQNGGGKLIGSKQRKDADNPEGLRKNQSKQVLKLSTVQIKSNEVETGKLSHPSKWKKQPLSEVDSIASPIKRKKRLSNFNILEAGIDTLNQKESEDIPPPTKYQGQFSDQTIFPNHSPHSHSHSPPHQFESRPRLRLILKQK